MSAVRRLDAARRTGRAAHAARQPYTSNPYAGSDVPGARLLARAWLAGYAAANPMRASMRGAVPDVAPEDVDPA